MTHRQCCIKFIGPTTLDDSESDPDLGFVVGVNRFTAGNLKSEFPSEIIFFSQRIAVIGLRSFFVLKIIVLLRYRREMRSRLAQRIALRNRVNRRKTLDQLSVVDMLMYIAFRSDLLLQIRSQRRYDHIWSHFYSEDGGEMTESGDDWDDFIDHDVKTFVERGDVVNAYIRASGPLVR